MDKCETITIRKVANGFMVEPLTQPHMMIRVEDVEVYQSLGLAQKVGDQTSLLEFLQEHFTSRPADVEADRNG